MSLFGPTLPSPASARDGSYRRISCRLRRRSITAESDPMCGPAVRCKKVSSIWRLAVWQSMNPALAVLNTLCGALRAGTVKGLAVASNLVRRENSHQVGTASWDGLAPGLVATPPTTPGVSQY